MLANRKRSVRDAGVGLFVPVGLGKLQGLVERDIAVGAAATNARTQSPIRTTDARAPACYSAHTSVDKPHSAFFSPCDRNVKPASVPALTRGLQAQTKLG